MLYREIFAFTSESHLRNVERHSVGSGSGSAVGIATGYGLDGSTIESRGM
jgi:hypothetical protein